MHSWPRGCRGLWAHYTGTCVGWGSSRHVYHRQVPHKDRFLIDLSGLGLEGSVWLPNCLKFGEYAGSLPWAELKRSI